MQASCCHQLPSASSRLVGRYMYKKTHEHTFSKHGQGNIAEMTQLNI